MLQLQEVDELVAEWQPAPLVPPDPLGDFQTRTPVVDSPPGPRATVDGVPDVLNFATLNFWGLGGHSDTQARPL